MNRYRVIILFSALLLSAGMVKLVGSGGPIRTATKATTSALRSGLGIVGGTARSAVGTVGGAAVGIAGTGVRAGLGVVGDVAGAGLGVVGDVAGAGLGVVGDVAGAGFDVVGDVAGAGFDAAKFALGTKDGRYATLAAVAIGAAVLGSKELDKRRLEREKVKEQAAETKAAKLKKMDAKVQDGVMRRLLNRFDRMSSLGDWYGVQEYTKPWDMFATDNANIMKETGDRLQAWVKKVQQEIDSTWTGTWARWGTGVAKPIAKELKNPDQRATLAQFGGVNDQINSLSETTTGQG